MDEYLDNTMEADDIFPCKGCGEILEEGNAFELGRSTPAGFHAITAWIVMARLPSTCWNIN